MKLRYPTETPSWVLKRAACKGQEGPGRACACVELRSTQTGLKVLLKVLTRLLKARLKVLLKVLTRRLKADLKVLLKVLTRLLEARLKVLLKVCFLGLGARNSVFQI